MMLRMDKRKVEKERDKLSSMVSEQVSARRQISDSFKEEFAKSNPAELIHQTPEKESRHERAFGTSGKKIWLKKSGIDLSASMKSGSDLDFQPAVIEPESFKPPMKESEAQTDYSGPLPEPKIIEAPLAPKYDSLFHIEEETKSMS